MKKLLATLIVLGLAVTPAFALSVESWFIDIASFSDGSQSLYDWGTLYDYGVDSSNPNDWVPNNNPGASSITNGVPQATDGDEDSFGIFRVKSITGSVSGTVFNGETASNQIVGFIYGFDDIYLGPGFGGKTQVLAMDGKMSLWSNNNDWMTSANLGTAGRTGVNTFSGVTTGTKLLEADAHVMYDTFLSTNYTFASQFSFTPPYGGNGDVYFDVDATAGGAWQDLLNTDGFDVYTPTNADIYINFSSQPSNVADWIVRGNGYGNANAVVPEPASMVLFGLGLAGLIRKRRMVS